MLVRQLNEGRAEVENEFTRAVTRDGNGKAKALVAEVFELRRTFEWRGLGEVPYSALRIKESYRRVRRRGALRDRIPLGARQQGVRMRRDPARREEADRLQGVRHRLHAGEPDRLVHGVVRRRVRRALHVRALQRRARSSPRRPLRGGDEACGMSGPYARRLHPPGRLQARPRGHDPRRRRPRDGAADRGALPARLRQRMAARRATTARASRSPAGPAGDGHRQPRRVAAVLSRRRHRLPVGARHDQRCGDDGRGAAASCGGLHPGGGLSAGGPAAHRRVDGGRGARSRRAGRHRRHQGGRAGARATACSSRRPAWASSRRASTSRGDRARPGDRDPRQRHAWATTAWRSCRCARTCRSRPRSRRIRRRCTASWPRC